MYNKTPVVDETESLSQDEILWGEIMLVDPRDYEIHRFNVRTEDPERGIKSLEDSVLEVGFRYPSLADEHKKILDGGRRWRIAMKHMLKIPMVHLRYGDEAEADLDRAIDSIVGNMGIPNSPKELGRAVNALTEMGMAMSTIAQRLGVSVNIVNNWSVTHKIPQDLLPEENPEVEEMWEGLTPRARKTFETIRRSTDLPPKERIEQLKDYTKMTYSERDAMARDVQDGGQVDTKARLAITTEKYSHEEFNCPLQVSIWIKRMIRMRGWDLQGFRIAGDVLYKKGIYDMSQEQYMMYKDGDPDESEEQH